MRTSTLAFDEFTAAVMRTHEVVECQMVARGFDCLVEVRMAEVKGTIDLPV